MVPPYRRIVVNVVVILLLCLQTNTHARKSKKHLCPIGFNIAYTKYKGDPVCYRLKGPEAFADKFQDCAGNLYTSKLYHSLNITKIELELWTEYKSLYPGGPFIDWSYTESTGDLLLTTYDVNYDHSLGIEQELCVVIDPMNNFTAASCDKKHYRYCFVKPYPDDDDMSKYGCEKLRGSWKFSSPTPTCLTSVAGVGGGAVRATWSQAEELCEKRGGSLLNRGWRYSNNPLLHASGSYPMYPLSIVFNPENPVLRFDADNGSAVIPSTDWNFENTNFPSDTTLGAVRDNFWYLVNSSYIFYDVICERTIELKNVTLNVTVDRENKVVLSISDSVNENDIYCFTDSVIYYPNTVKMRYDNEADVFVLKPIADGYYWCIHVDSKNFKVSESNKALFIREKQSVVNLYDVKIYLKNKYKFESLEKFYRNWERKLKEYIFYRTKYTKVYGEESLNDPSTSEDVLKSFKASYSGLTLKEKEIIIVIKIKKLYLDARTALVQIELNPEMEPVPPGSWDDLEVLFMKPAFYCKGFDTVPMVPLGQSTTTPGCRTYSCVGDFNEGVQWVATATEECTTRSSLKSDLLVTDVARLNQVTLLMPTIGTMPGFTTTRDFLHRENPDSSEEYTQSSHHHQLPSKPTTVSYEVTETTTSETTDLTTVTEASVTETTPEPDTVSTVNYPSEIITATPPIPPKPTTTRPPTTRPPATRPPTTTTTTSPPTTRPPPEEQLQQVMQDLEALINNDTVPVSVENISGAFDQVDELLSDSKELEIPGELLRLLDGIGARIALNGSENVTAVRENIALLVADSQPDLPVRGLRIAARQYDVFTDNAFEIIRDEMNSTHMNTEESEVVVQLPLSVAESARRISFVVFRNDRAFQNNLEHHFVNSRVLSIKVENVTEFQHGEVIDIHLSPMRETPDRNQSRVCAYWHFLENGSGYWSQEGCTFIRAAQPGMLDTCRCDHLTHFAEILIPRTVFSERHEAALEVISVIGCCLSIVGVMMVGLTAVLFRSWRRDFSNKIWLQLCMSIFILVTCFLIVVFAKFEEYNIGCMLVGILLHYSVLASFCWMLVAAVLSYRRLVMVFTRDASHKLLKASAFSWGAPCAVVGVLLSVAPLSYAGQFEGNVPSGAFCYPSGLGLWLAVYAPVALMLLANWTLFILIVRSVFASRRIQRHGDSNEALRCASVSCLLVFLFGLPWVFGLFLANIVTVYLYTLTATFQGFVLFVFFVLGNKKTRDLWLNKLKIKQTQKVPVTSSTYTNRSTGANVGWRGGSRDATSMEAKSSKPRSLASSDNSRFS